MNQIATLVDIINEELDPQTLIKQYSWNIQGLMNGVLSKNVLSLSVDEVDGIVSSPTPFEQNRLLKRLIHVKLSADPLDYDVLFWIIRDWGGIKAFTPLKAGEKKNRNSERIEDFYNSLNENRPLSPKLFQVISSLSKLASFWNPEIYTIYDNRAVYTLNYLIKLVNDRGIPMKYFPTKNGSRNKIVKANPIKEMIDNLDNSKFNNESVAYYKYCKLIKEINEILYPNFPKEPFRTEMLLFSSIEVPFLAMGGELHELMPNTSKNLRELKNDKMIKFLTKKKKYYFLQEYLMNAAAKNVTIVNLSIKKINELVDKSGKGKLPESAFTYQPFWGNDLSSPTHVWKNAWLSQGFIVVNTTNVVNVQRRENDSIPENGTVTFNLIKRNIILDHTNGTIGIEDELKEDLSRLYSKIIKEIPTNTPQYFYKTLQEKRPVQVVESLFNPTQQSDGFTILKLLGRLDLTVEFLIVNQTKYHAFFTPEIIEMAKKRIGR